MGRFHAENPGDLIRVARLDAGLTQSKLAQLAGLQQPSLAQMEAGTRNISPDMLERVLKAADYRPSIALAQHFDAIMATAARHGLRNLRVFGSVARGQDGFNSDIDLLATPDEGTDLFDLGLFIEECRQITGFPIDVIVDTHFSELSDDLIREAVPL